MTACTPRSAAPTAAVLAARDAQLAFAAEAWGITGPLLVRMGMHTCQAEVRDGDYYGSVVNWAARLMSVANGGQVVMSLATEELGAGQKLPSDASLLDLGEHRLRVSLTRRTRFFQLCAPGPRLGVSTAAVTRRVPATCPASSRRSSAANEDIASITKALTRSPLVTLTGVGGVGKTRLAIQVAAHVAPEYPDGVWFSELAGVNDDEAVVQLVATTLGVQPRAACRCTTASSTSCATGDSC